MTGGGTGTNDREEPMSAKRSPNRSKRGPQETPGSPSTALTERERQIMHLVCEGQSNKKVGRKLNLSESTVKVHLHHIYQKLAIRNRTVLAAGVLQFKDDEP
jgi:DNA-binding NarL/FixJ family response regulator